MKFDWMKRNKAIVLKAGLVMGGFALFFGVVISTALKGGAVVNNETNSESYSDALKSEIPLAEETTVEEATEVAFETQVGAATYFDGEGVLYRQRKVEVTEAEKLYGANIEVLSANQRKWREVKDEVGNVAVTTAGNYVNIREDAEAGAELIGKAYTGAVVSVVGEVTDDEGAVWYQISSGDVEGYASAAYFLTGESLVEELSDEEEYFNEEYLTNKEDWKLAITLEEEERLRKEELEKLRKQQQQDRETIEKNRKKAVDKSNVATEEAKEAARNGDTSLLRSQMIDYAMQFLGNRYINGGQSLVDGTDCSGFTCFIYRDFGYSIDRTPAAQYQNAGRSISLEEARPGDIVCYGKSSVTHVALYMGNGKIIHSANSRKGVVIYDVGYDNIIGIKSVMD
ncbi:MAG: NlpC/P60 family protein [Lachnospiraceae bacterium]|nr:NlpC/P60 family protein [Lachnospiraceae bacterium]